MFLDVSSQLRRDVAVSHQPQVHTVVPKDHCALRLAETHCILCQRFEDRHEFERGSPNDLQ
jgi:hypothetical protein